MTRLPYHDQQKIMVVVEEENDIASYEHPLLPRQVSGLFRLVVAGIVLLVVGRLLLGLGSALVEVLMPPDPAPFVEAAPTTFTHVQDTLHQQVSFAVRRFTVTTTLTIRQDNDDFLWVFPVDQTSVDYHASGMVTVGYDLTQASVLAGGDGNLHVFLPMPTVLDVDAQPELSYFEVETPTNGSIAPETMITILSRAEDALEQASYARGLVAEANDSGPQLIAYELFPGVENLLFHTQAPTEMSP